MGAAANVVGFLAVAALSGTVSAAQTPTASSQVATPPAEAQTPEGVGAQLEPGEGHAAKGSLSLSMDGGFVRLGGVIEGLPPAAEFVLYVQDRRVCNESTDHHRGTNLGYVRSDAKGRVNVDLTARSTGLQSGNLKYLVGKALVVQAKPPSNEVSTGSTSSWIACGMIK